MARNEWYGTRGLGGRIWQLAQAEDWQWAGWRGPERVCGSADDKTNAICALAHFLGVDD